VLKDYSALHAQAMGANRQTLAVVEAGDHEVIEACVKAHHEGVADSLFIGNPDKILAAAATVGLKPAPSTLIPSQSPEESVRIAATLVREGRASMLMKGHLPTAALMKGVLDKENGLRTGSVLSHVMVAYATNLDRWLLMSDAGLNIAPDADMLAAIVRNAVAVAHSLGITRPKVACLSAVEVENPKIPSTLLCAEMKKRNEKGDISGCLVEGPMAIDLALSQFAVKAKEYPTNGVAGAADVLIVPELVSGNVLGKAFIYCASYRCSGIIVGARVPIVLLSRSDTADVKLDSIALACVYAQFHKVTS